LGGDRLVAKKTTFGAVGKRRSQQEQIFYHADLFSNKKGGGKFQGRRPDRAKSSRVSGGLSRCEVRS